MALDGVTVLLLSRDAVPLGDQLAGEAHVDVMEAVPEAVVNHRVDDRRVAHAQAFAHAVEKIGAVAHRLHAAGDRDVDVAGRDPL